MFYRLRSSLVFTFLSLVPFSAVFGQEITEITITAVRDTSTVRTEDSLVAPPDTSTLLRKMPGADINKNGELTGIAQYRGMFGDRVNVTVDGNNISSGGPNAMDAPLHYAPVALMESLSIQRGIAPVSAGQETLGGHVAAESYKGDFAASNDLQFHARIYTGLQSVNSGSVISGLFTLANDQHLMRASLLHEEGDDSDFADGRIIPSSSERERLDLGYSFNQSNHAFSVDFARNNTGPSGTAALPMDIMSVDSDLFSAAYQWQGRERSYSLKLSSNEVAHWMSNFHLRVPPQDNAMTTGAMRYRQTFAEGEDAGFSVQVEQRVQRGLWRAGLDGHYADHDARISNPNAGMFYIENFKDVSRDITGLYVETELALKPGVGMEGGLRFNQVRMNAAPVSSNLNPMNVGAGMPPMLASLAGTLAAQFNSSVLAQQDENFDWFGRLSMEAGSNMTWYLGLARKTRSPSYQERYLWLPLESTGGLADGFTYIGSADLQPEVSHEAELGFDWDNRAFSFYPRAFYKKVSDYIQGSPVTNMQATMFAQMMATMNGVTPKVLQFGNVDARFYGLDIESALELNDRLLLRSNLSMVRATREDINEDLYRIAPDNLSVSLHYQAENWTAALESLSYAKQDRVSVIQTEQMTAGYSILSLSAQFNLTASLEIGLGVNNLFDKYYQDHLAGYNRAVNPSIAIQERLPGLGRNLYGRLIWRF